MNLIDLEIGKFATTKEWEVKNFYIRRKSELDFSCYRNGIFERNLPSIPDDGSSCYSYFYKDDFKLCDCNGKLLEKESIYPLYMENIIHNSVAGRVVKFDSLKSGKVVIRGNSITSPGHTSADWIYHTNIEHWKPCDFSKAPEVADLDYWDARYNAGLPVYYSFNYENNKTCYKANLLPSVLFKDNNNIKFHISDLSESKPKFSEQIIGVDYASQPDIAFVPQEGIKSRLHNDEIDALSYSNPTFRGTITGAAKNVANNLNQTKEFTMTKELQEAILELIATNGKPKVKKPKTPKIVCNVEGTLMEFADEAALKSFMWSSRVESVIRYDLTGKVTVPFELSVEAPKTKASK